MRGDEEEVNRLRHKYESFLEGTRAYQQLKFEAPFLLGGEGTSIDSLNTAELIELLEKSSEIRLLINSAGDFVARGRLYAYQLLLLLD